MTDTEIKLGLTVRLLIPGCTLAVHFLRLTGRHEEAKAFENAVRTANAILIEEGHAPAPPADLPGRILRVVK